MLSEIWFFFNRKTALSSVSAPVTHTTDIAIEAEPIPSGDIGARPPVQPITVSKKGPTYKISDPRNKSDKGNGQMPKHGFGEIPPLITTGKLTNTEKKDSKPARKLSDDEPVKNNTDNMVLGKALYDNQNWSAAIAAYNKEIYSTDDARRHEAIMMTARCYHKIGMNDKARQLLKNVVSDNGADKHTAKKMLRSIKHEE